ncbi:MAG: AzlD family protein, partial [Alphaproteobacteria bacterium]
GGFWAMGFVAVTPRLRAALEAIPIAVMTAILAPAALKGGLAEATGLAVAMFAMRATGSDLAAAAAGVATVALVRAAAA